MWWCESSIFFHIQSLSNYVEKIEAPTKLRIGVVWGSICLLFIAIVWTAASIKIERDEQQLIEKLRADTEQRARNHAEQLLRTISQIDQLSLSIKYYWERNGVPNDLEEQFRRGLYHESMFPVAIDANGYALTNTRNLKRGTFMGDIDFFKHTRESSGAKLQIAPPAEGRGGLKGRQIIRFTRRIDKADGSFGGIILIAVEVNYLLAFPDMAKLPAGDFVSARFIDGPVIGTRSGENTRTAFYSSSVRFDGDTGSRIEPADVFIDQQVRVVGWERIEGYPIVLVAASSLEHAFAPYESTRNSYLTIAGLVSGLLLLVSVFGASVQIRSAVQRRHQAQVQSTFRLAVDAAREAFYMIRPAGQDNQAWVVEDCNERAAEMQQRGRGEVIGRTIDQLFEGRELNELRIYCNRVLDEGFHEDEFHVPHDRQHVAGWFQRRGVRSGQGIAVTVRDVSDARQQAETLARMARTDSLTGLPNRHWLNQHLPSVLENAAHTKTKVALLYLDLDNFKHINDALGHRTGDDVLVAIARTLSDIAGGTNQLARIGGDEFTVLLETLDHDAQSQAELLAYRLIAAIEVMSASSAWRAFNLRASVGISLYPDDAQDVDGLLMAADIAMYEAKSEGKAQARHYDEAYGHRIRERITIEHALELAIQNEEFVVYYQPRADARSGELTSMEALIRWRHPERGLLSPVEFISVAEQTGLIVPIGEYVVRKVCQQIADWRDQGLPIKPVSVNVSALQLKGEGLRLALRMSLKRFKLSPTYIAFELTESSMLDEDGVAQSELRKLREMGIELEIDDFGTGYSSLSKLQSLEIDVLKIDQSFVRRLGKDVQASALCETMVSVGRNLDISVVAEGVETTEQLSLLQQMGCDQIQGYLISPPLPPDEIIKLFGKVFFPTEFLKA
jgi:diguanylate cyclase (GGDEF)-like protein